MAGLVEFFFDYVSPYGYLANTQLSKLEIPIARYITSLYWGSRN
jgi:2-hydroxychromene-2-carboxylate isomerase